MIEYESLFKIENKKRKGSIKQKKEKKVVTLPIKK